MTIRIATFDIDGTLTIGHGWYFIASLLGREDDYRRYTAMFRAGKSDEARHLSNLLSIAEGVSLNRLYSALEEVPRLRNIAAGIRMLGQAGMEVMLLTHNPQYVCEWYERRFGFSGHCSAFQAVDGGIVGSADGVFPDKAAWLKDMCALKGISPQEVIHTGDSASDAAVFRTIGHGIAVNSRDREVIKSAGYAINTVDMKDVARLLLRISE